MSHFQLQPRRYFLERTWQYYAGEMVLFLGHTGSGKSTLKMQMIDATSTVDSIKWRALTEPVLPQRIIIVDTKPRNREVTHWANLLRFPVTPTIPVPVMVKLRAKIDNMEWDKFVFRPPHVGHDEDDIERRLAQVIRRVVASAYRSNSSNVIDIDEILDWVDLQLTTLMRVVLTRGRGADTGLWGGTQKPSHIPTFWYNNATHLLLAQETDDRNLKRIKEVSGIDGEAVVETVRGLPKYHWLYLRPFDNTGCIIGP